MGLIRKFDNLIYPKRCAYCDRVLGNVAKCALCEPLIMAIKREEGIAIDKKGRVLDFVDIALAPYWYVEPVKSGILRFKFGKRQDLAKYYASELILVLRACNILPIFDIIIPVPTGIKELKRKGYSVPYLLAMEVSRQNAVPLCTNAIVKPKDTPPQMSLSGEKRRANLLGAFTVTDLVAVKNKTILLVDDVLTTGSTVNECAKMLLISGAKACCSVCIAVGSIATK
ncbi:MAG: phosphoribosyltransferase family protein [Oscillospiraceae bacterium]